MVYLCANPWQTHAAMSLFSRYELRSFVRRPAWRQFLFLCISGTFVTAGMANFVNFETAPVHPIALSPDARALALCNLPDGRVELFDVSTGTPVSIGDVPVGIDPVSLRFRDTNELWVVNYISSSVNIIDLRRRRVAAVLPTFSGPADVVFAGNPQRAFVSCARSNVLMVFNPVSRASITNIPIKGDRPRAMTVSPDGSKVYVAIFESGNASTILGARRPGGNGFLSPPPPPSAVDATNGPYGGQNPPPNSGNAFSPPINPAITGSLPHVSHIVKKNSTGRWVDGNGADWTEFVSGTNAALSGRVPGWDMPDRDLAVIDTATLNVSYVCRLMNICMDVAVNPASGKIAVVGTDALNELRFEPNLQSIFLHVNIALIDPASSNTLVKDLNPHLDYTVRRIPQGERDKSVGDPRGVIWSADGTRCYVTGMGSRNLVVLDADGNRLQTQPIELEDGPTGLALDESRQRLYVLNRFSASISVVHLGSMTVLTNVAFFDPTPDFIKAGRRFLYDTHSNSGLGQASCASCHVDGRFDRLAWDLGDPSATTITNQFGQFHPMKGPKMTQTFQGLNPDGALHWRADREGIGQFNQTFVKLLGRDNDPSDEDAVFGSMLNSILFPPNPLRNFDNTLSTNVPLPGQYAYDPAWHAPGNQPLPNGNAWRGGFFTFHNNCTGCHVPGSGLGNPVVQTLSDGKFKVAQLRSLPDKLGFEMSRPESRAGFGFSHDGRVDTLSRLIGDSVIDIPDVQEVADLIAFLLSFSGSDISFVGSEGFENLESNRDAPAAFGFQTMLTNSQPTTVLTQMMALASTPTFEDPSDFPSNRLELIARGSDGQQMRGWQYLDGYFQSDRNEQLFAAADLFGLASQTNEIVFTLVGRNTGRRIATDRDNDGNYNLTEVDWGYDPAQWLSHSTNVPLRINVLPSELSIVLDDNRPHTQTFPVVDMDGDENPDLPNRITYFLGGTPPSGAAIDSVTGTFTWTPRFEDAGTIFRIPIRVSYMEGPELTETVILKVTFEPIILIPPTIDSVRQRVILGFRYPNRRPLRVQYTDSLTSPSVVWHDLGYAFGDFADDSWPLPPQRFYRVQNP